MQSLADRIEQHIKDMIKKQKVATLELKRNDLAEAFECVPSQINYVLSTRFTFEQGYIIESRRGGGGFIRITRIAMEKDKELVEMINETAGRLISQRAGEGLVGHLAEEGLLTRREGMLIKAMINREALPVDLPMRDMVRASMLRAMLLTLLRKEFND